MQLFDNFRGGDSESQAVVFLRLGALVRKYPECHYFLAKNVRKKVLKKRFFFSLFPFKIEIDYTFCLYFVSLLSDSNESLLSLGVFLISLYCLI